MQSEISSGRASDWDKSHNIYCLLDAHYTDNTPFKVIAKFLRESKIHKALTDKTEVYESHVRIFWNSVRYEEKEKMIYSAVRKKDENGQDVDVEIKFNVGDLRRVLDLGDSDDDPTIIPEILCKGLWCRMGFTGHLNGKMIKTMSSKPYKFMIHCVVHALSHRKGAYDETSDYTMNIITCLNVGARSGKYIMYPRFIQMMMNDLVKDIPKDAEDILGVRNMTADTISRLAKGPGPRVRRMICKIDNPAYVAPENDAWRHDNRPSSESQQKLVDDPFIDPTELIKQEADILNMSYNDYLKKNEEVTAQKEQSSSVPTESVKEKEHECVSCDDSSEADDESTETEPKIDLATVGRGKVQMKKKPQKKRKGSDEEDITYTPTVQEKKKLRIKRKAVQSGVIPRNVRTKKGGASIPKSQSGKSEKHVTS
ncbi:hypothetical protein Hanom_Chr08g00753191 [Helianthus anomalus]